MFVFILSMFGPECIFIPFKLLDNDAGNFSTRYILKTTILQLYFRIPLLEHTVEY